MKTRITELFGIRHPIVLSGMGWISVPKMVAAVSEAGGLGILATGPGDPQTDGQALRRECVPDAAGGSGQRARPHRGEGARDQLRPGKGRLAGEGDPRIRRQGHLHGANYHHASRAQDYGAVAELIERVVTEADAIQKKMAVALAQ